MIILWVLFAYLLGSVSSAILVSRILGLEDPRSQGSGNPGATNVLRLGGKKAAIIVLVADILKGTIPVGLAHWMGLEGMPLGWIACAAVIGHIFPIFFQFKGGKGVATAIGSLLALSWPLALTLIGTWLLVAVITRYSSLAAIIAACLAPLYNLWLFNETFTLPVLFISALLLWRHIGNIQRLLSGTEPKIKS